MGKKIKSKAEDQCVHRLAVILYDFFQFLCALGFLVQFSYVMIRYFDFDYLTIAHFFVPEETKLPDVFLCADFLSFLNYTLLFQRYPQLIGALGLSRNQILGRPIKDEILSRMTGEDASYLISSFLTLRQVTECFFPSDVIFGTLDIRSNFERNFHDLCDLKLYYRKFFVCFVFSCSQNGSIFTSIDDFYRDPIPEELFLLRLRQSVFASTDFLFIGATEHLTLPFSPSCKMDVQIVGNYPRAFRYHLKTVQLKLLPPPYETSCRDYSEIQTNFTTRDGIIDSCLTQRSIIASGCPHPLSLQSSTWNSRFATECYRSKSGNVTYRRLMNSIVDDCFRLNAQPDCSRTAIFTQGRSPVSISGNFSTLVMDETKEPSIIIAYTPKMTWIDLFVQIGSVLGTWFGFSILIHIPKVSKFLVYHFHSCVTCFNCYKSPRKMKDLLQKRSLDSKLSLSWSKKSQRSKSRNHPIRYLSPRRILVQRT